MSELFDEEEREQPPPARPSGRSRALVVTAVVLVIAFFGLSAFASIYTDRLWFREVGYGQVFSTLIWTRILLFLVFSVVMALAVGASIMLAYRFRPLFRPSSPEQTNLDRYREAVTPIRTWLVLGVAAVVGAFAGGSGMGQWRNFLLWRNSEPFNQKDAYFEKDIGFYVFQLPWLHYLVDFVMAVAVVSLIAAAVVHYLFGGIRLQAAHDRLSGAAQAQLSVLLGVFVLAKGVDYYLDRFDLVNENHRLFTGMNNAAENAVLPAKNILLGVAVICAVLFLLNAWRRTWQLPVVGLALLVLSSILLGMIWPAIVQQFQVKPSEADKEETYIQANINATLEAYGLSDIEYEGYSSAITETPTLDALSGDVAQVPVVDPKLVRETFQQRQQGRAYYSVAPVLDVDRYTLDGVETPLVLGVRELDQEGINPSDQNWSNLHTTYTHGEGLIAAYANETAAASDLSNDDKIEWAEGLEAGEDVLSTATDEFEDRIYFGEQSPDYSVVGKPTGSEKSVELGLGVNDAQQDRTTTYDGEGGVKVGGLFHQLLYAIKFGEPNFLLSGRVNDNSKVLYIREPAKRVEKVAPWLTLDSDAYPAIVDDKVVWILDGYTTTDRYPNSQRESFQEMIDDSLQQPTGFQTLPTDEINYMRSAVKATVDAYDGTVNIYAWDETDPILKAWRGAFPDTVQDKGEMPEDLVDHLRYPEDYFKVQRYLLAKYHITDAGDFYQASDRWEVPEDPNARSFQPPYRVFTDPDGAGPESTQWALTSVFTPRGKGNLASFVSVNSDANSDQFGKFKILDVAEPNARGPGQIANEMETDDEVVQALQPFRIQGSTPPLFGNLLTLPVDEGLIYIEPVYAVRSATSGFPILQFVIVSYQGEVGIGRSLTEALKDSLGVTGNEPAPTPEPTPDPTPGEPDPDPEPEPTGTVNEQIRSLLDEAETLFAQADTAKSNGNFQGWARLMDQGRDKITEAVRLADQRDQATPGTQ